MIVLDVIQMLGTWLIGGAGIWLLLRRGKQIESQLKNSNRELSMAGERLILDQYQRGLSMLSDSAMWVRVGGVNIFARRLRKAKEEGTEEYQEEIVKLLCDFIRNPTVEREATYRFPEDLQTALNVVANLPDAESSKYKVNLTGADLGYSDMRHAKFNSADLTDANLENIKGNFADFSNVEFFKCSKFGDVSGANFLGVQIGNASFKHCYRTHFTFCKDLYQIDMKGVALWRSAFDHTEKLNGNFSKAKLQEATMIGTVVWRCDFTDADMTDLDLTGATFDLRYDEGGKLINLSCVTKITQLQLDQAIADPSNPPQFHDNIIDHETGKPIVWKRKERGERWREFKLARTDEPKPTDPYWIKNQWAKHLELVERLKHN